MNATSLGRVWLYEESWTDPGIRWLLSTLPSSMIFDDHDVRDDWNTSAQWRREMQARTWWEERIIGALSSYWIYQHLGNLAPQTLAENALYQTVRAHDGDVAPLLREFAAAADKEADGRKGAQWSYRRDLGDVRLLVIDSRCGRMLETGDRSIVSEAEFAWIERQVEGDYDHLLVGTWLPWLLPRALHDVEAWNERLADGSREPCSLASGEASTRVPAAGRRPPSACSRAMCTTPTRHGHFPAEAGTAPIRSKIYQMTCSPVHNFIPPAMKVIFRVSWSRVAETCTRFLLQRVSHLPAQPLSWERLAGPHVGKEIATLRLDGRSATLVIEKAGRAPGGDPILTPVVDLTLS